VRPFPSGARQFATFRALSFSRAGAYGSATPPSTRDRLILSETADLIAITHVFVIKLS
jgi:hypothetical protein